MNNEFAYFEDTYSDIDEYGNKFVTIDGYPTDEDKEGTVIVVIYKTPHNDIVIDWHRNDYRLNEDVLKFVNENINSLKKEKTIFDAPLKDGEYDVDCWVHAHYWLRVEADSVEEAISLAENDIGESIVDFTGLDIGDGGVTLAVDKDGNETYAE